MISFEPITMYYKDTMLLFFVWKKNALFHYSLEF